MSNPAEPRSNATRFILAFNRIERRLAELGGVDERRSFGEKLRAAARIEPAVAHIERPLREFAELRNALVHSDRDLPLAEPRDAVVQEIERYQQLLHNPPRIGERYTRPVATVFQTDPVRLALRRMRHEGYTQLPVRDRAGSCVGLFTGESVARWLGALEEGAGGGVDLDGTSVQEVLRLAGGDERHTFLSPGATLFEALAQFEQHQRQGHRLDAILITQDARPDQRLLGIITPRNLPEIVLALDELGAGDPAAGDATAGSPAAGDPAAGDPAAPPSAQSLL
ncbi:MAG: CBS domain-containing protein [Anaerolineae bacterium]|jgi:CBS domain-containing protein|nr:CBS domain-containing protein [Chloroflexota bacterium]